MQEYLIAFAVGGTICALSQLLMDKTKTDARPNYGYSCGYRRSFRCIRHL